ncbi:MAG: metal-dependent hydrolase [Acidimicrobiia bacterium]|nr:metal-dependent hydrolase [Acidimicrobiia bacterium]MDH4308831.1 metal-dependent hydrolase [Acidimicrobiia bacterium]MDH5292731.1 metal-dependent hydrolase [Acidimicrobiia bacterium]
MDLNGIELTWLGHAGVRLRLDDGTTVLVDPWLTGNPACPESEQSQERIDAIYLTHGHFDHFGDTLSLAREHGCQVFAIHEIAVYLEGQGIEAAVGSNKGGMVEGPGGIRGFLTDAVHSSGISGDTGIVSGGEAGGWIFDVPNGPTIYHAGDTTIFGDMTLIKDIFSPDIALLPIGGHYTMGAGIAAKAAKLIGAETIIPIHFGTFPILAGTPDELTDAGGGAFEVQALEPGVPVT